MRFLLAFFIFCSTLPTYAQFSQGLRGVVSSQVGHTVTQQALANALNQSLAAAAAKQALPPELQQSVFTLKEGHLIFQFFDHKHASAFVVAEQYKGNTFLWGVSALHYHFSSPSMEEIPGARAQRIRTAVKGNDVSSDIILFPLPAKLADRYKPLPLAKKLPQPGEALHSVGFFQNKFQHETNRMVQIANPFNLVTSIAESPKELHFNRVGACGGPILNENNEVVGIHTGSSSGASVGYGVPVTQLRRLMQAYHEGQSLRPFLLNGTQIGTLDITDDIQHIEIWNKGELQRILSFTRKGTDYDTLSSYLSEIPADKIRFIFRRTPLTNKEKEHLIIITYQIDTRQTTYEQNDQYFPPQNPKYPY